MTNKDRGHLDVEDRGAVLIVRIDGAEPEWMCYTDHIVMVANMYVNDTT